MPIEACDVSLMLHELVPLSYFGESHGQPLFTQVICQVKILQMLFPPVHIEDQPPTGGFRVPNLKLISCATWATEKTAVCKSLPQIVATSTCG